MTSSIVALASFEFAVAAPPRLSARGHGAHLGRRPRGPRARPGAGPLLLYVPGPRRPKPGL